MSASSSALAPAAGPAPELVPGFADPVADSQRCFRALLDAMSRPGTLAELAAAPRPPAPLDPATAAVLLTLLDGEASLWAEAAMAPAWPWLRFHSGAGAAAGPADAQFVLTDALPDLALLHAGTDLAPEDGATVVLQLPALGEGRAWRLRGPGIEREAVLRARGLPGDFAARWAANHALYPRGVDLVLCAGARLCALPRGVRVTDAGEG